MTPKSLFVTAADFLSREEAKALADRALTFAKANSSSGNST